MTDRPRWLFATFTACDSELARGDSSEAGDVVVVVVGVVVVPVVPVVPVVVVEPSTTTSYLR